MKQIELAKQLGISKSYLSMILSGQRKASPEMAMKISSLFFVNSEAKLCLGSKHSTAELHPQLTILSNGKGIDVKDGSLWYECQQFFRNFRIFGNEE